MLPRLKLGLIAHEYIPLVGGMTTYARALAAHMEQVGFDVHIFATRRAAATQKIHPILTSDLAQDIPALMKYDMDLWHAVNFGYAPMAFVKRPFILTVHGTDFLTPWVRPTMDRLPGLWRLSPIACSRRMRRLVYPRALKRIDQIVTCSRFSAERFRQEYPSVSRVEVVPNGVDESLLSRSETEHVQRHPRQLLTVANLGTANRRKNVDGVIRAMARVGPQLDLQYHIVGDGEGRGALEALASSLDVADRVVFHGRVDDLTLRRLYAESSLFVLAPRPEPGDVEGFGIVYLEAAGQGTPSLASRCGGAVDAIRDGVSGFFVDQPTPEGIARALRRFFTRDIGFNSEAVYAHAESYAWPRVLTDIERIYERCLSRTHAVRRSGRIRRLLGKARAETAELRKSSDNNPINRPLVVPELESQSISPDPSA